MLGTVVNPYSANVVFVDTEFSGLEFYLGELLWVLRRWKDAAEQYTEVVTTQPKRKYAREALQQPAFLRPWWRSMLAACRRQLRQKGAF